MTLWSDNRTYLCLSRPRTLRHIVPTGLELLSKASAAHHQGGIQQVVSIRYNCQPNCYICRHLSFIGGGV